MTVTPCQLIDAIKANQPEMVECFLKTGINIDTPLKYTEENTPLTAAVELNNLDMVKFLVEHGADINGREFSPLLTATYLGNRTFDIVKYLVEHGANVNVRNKRGDTPLYNAFCNSDGIEMVKFLVEHGANVNAVDNLNGETPIFVAPRWIEEGYSDRLDKFIYLIEHGADINVRNTMDDSSDVSQSFYIRNPHQAWSRHQHQRQIQYVTERHGKREQR